MWQSPERSYGPQTLQCAPRGLGDGEILTSVVRTAHEILAARMSTPRKADMRFCVANKGKRGCLPQKWVKSFVPLSTLRECYDRRGEHHHRRPALPRNDEDIYR